MTPLKDERQNNSNPAFLNNEVSTERKEQTNKGRRKPERKDVKKKSIKKEREDSG
jgi:hypothetical protein